MKLLAQVAGAEDEIAIAPLPGQPGAWEAVWRGATHRVEVQAIRPGSYWLRFEDGSSLTVDLDPGKDGDWVTEARGVTFPVKLLDARKRLLAQAQASRATAAATGPTVIRAPMPGKVVKVLAKAGDQVAAGAGLVVVEAMKMENELRAPRAGKVDTVHVKEGQAVEGAEALLTLSPV
jgi:biotin carboxyl carrier protein